MHVCDSNSLNSAYTRNVSGTSFRENKNIFSIQFFFFSENHAGNEIMLKNKVDTDRQKMAIRYRRTLVIFNTFSSPRQIFFYANAP